jgi:hypothetical protein
LSSLALRLIDDGVCQNDYLGYNQLSALLRALEIENLAFTQHTVFIAGKHNPQDAFVHVDAFASDLCAWLRETFPDLRGFPDLDSASFANTLKVLSEEVAVNRFFFSDTSKAVRDKLQDRGLSIGRNAVNFIIRGIYLSGHEFTSDRPQDPQTLADAFLKSLETSAPDLKDYPGRLRELRKLVAGALPSPGPQLPGSDTPERAESEPDETAPADPLDPEPPEPPEPTVEPPEPPGSADGAGSDRGGVRGRTPADLPPQHP